MKYLGIDFGSKRVGLAVSSEDGKFAFPLKTLDNNSKLLENTISVIKDEGIETLVFGLSKNSSMEENPIEKMVQDFISKLKESLPEISIDRELEYFSSVEAVRFPNVSQKKNLLDRKSKVEKIENIDEKAAAVILSRYLDKKKV